MADRVRVNDLDFVYISFKEPNKEQNWADLKSKVPWAKRVDGVEVSRPDRLELDVDRSVGNVKRVSSKV